MKHKKNITICYLKINIFTAVTYRNILYGRDIVMHVNPQVRYLTCADPENFLEGGGGGSSSDQGGSSTIPVESS